MGLTPRRKNNTSKNIYRLTIGRDIVIEGTIEELAYRMDMKPTSILQTSMPAYQKARKKQRFKLEVIGLLDMSKIYQMFDKENRWLGTGTIPELAEETGYTRHYLHTFIEGSKSLDSYMKSRVKEDAKPPITLIRVED
jgi:hypothetical protein